MQSSEFTNYFKSKYKSTSSFSSGLALFLMDAFALFICIGIGFFIVNIFDTSDINFKSFINYTIYIPFILIIYAFIGLYPGIMSSPTDDVKNFFISNFLCFMGIIISIFFANNHDNINFTDFFIKDSKDYAIMCAFLISIPISVIILPAFREIAKHIFRKYKWWGVPAVIYCSNIDSYFIINKLINNKSLGYHPAVIIDNSKEDDGEYYGIPVFNSNDKIISEIRKNNIKQAVLCDYNGDMSSIMTSFRYTITVSQNQNFFTSTQQLKDISGIIGLASIHNLTFKRNIFLKRFIDILSILILSPIWLPIFILIAILVKLTSKGPIFYGHKRIGQNGKEIKCWKFRSMCINSQEMLEQILATDPVRRAEWEKDRKFIDDPRVTKFGRFLRKTSLDELPQLINILVGDMSLVGPRPVTEPELVKYGEYKDYVLSVLPGLTGMWQVSGRSDTKYEERISFDSFYIQNWSIWLDIWILIKTVWVVLNGKGAY